MALTGKTIGQLELLQFPTNDTLLPVELSGDTYHIAFSAVNYTELTYSDLLTGSQLGELSPGSYYLMTDYQTCYDQPNYNNIKQPIYTDNYMTGNTEPILLLAMSTTGFSPTVYSTLYPQDKITYDITWNTTEVTNSPAKGRITERIDNFNNRTDYDNRSILFKRYNGYSYNENTPLSGLVGISGLTGTTAILYGDTGTTFNSDFSTGSLVAVTNISPSYFEVISVESDSLATISGATISETSDSVYFSTIDDGVMNYYQPNIRQNEVFEYTTFGDAIANVAAINNYVGNYANLYVWNENPFILANNVFISGSHINNTIGDNSYNNTFNDDCDSNQIGVSFYNNSTNDDFDGNIIGDYFNNNYITANFNNNKIGSDFDNNILINGSFYRNNIGNDFANNVCTNGDFQNNEIGNQFNNNKIYDDFYNNDIGNGYNGNDTYRPFYRNLIGNGFNNNNIYSDFYENEIGQVFNSNNISSLADRGEYDFSGNRIGNGFGSNTVRVDFIGNNIINYFNSNNILSQFNANIISNQFTQNNIYNAFNENSFGENVNSNTFGLPSNIGSSNFSNNNIGGDFTFNYFSGDTQYNTISYGCDSNNVDTNFSYNQIGAAFESNTIANDFGFGGGSYRGNIVGNGFNGNTVGEYCYNNTFGDNCNGNNLSDNFLNNIVSYGFNNVTINNLDTPGTSFQNNNFTYGYFNGDLTLTGGTGGNPIFYSVYPTNVTKDVNDTNNYVTFLSGGTIVAQTITI